MTQWSPVESKRIAAAQPHVEAAARAYGVDASLINAVIWVESRFDDHARSRAGARGLMQLMPATSRELARKMGVASRPYDPSFNVRAGTYYLAQLISKFGSEVLGLAAYKSGPGSVRKWEREGRALPESSRRYIQKIESARRKFAAVARGPGLARG
ncbi:MAG: lytic transglycosylase domain-containing protein [Nannocystaceae bacterium]|nr:lytic transglycosylase domain-containing protein [Myxococcales bacterium]